MAEWQAFRSQEKTPALVAEMLAHSNPRSRLDAIRSGLATQAQIQALIADADTAIRAKDLDEAEAIKARQHAEDVLKNRSADVSYASAEAELAQALAQLQAIKKLRKPH